MAKSITEKTTLVKLENPKAVAEYAKELADFINKSNLAVPIDEKKYVLVEGWQFAGASMGIFPKIVNVEQIPTEGTVKFKIKGFERENPIYKYRATVELVRLSDGIVIGQSTASCSNQEWKKKTFDEYAVESMAQTRAVGKAFRLTLGWVVKLAGFEATPAEEVIEDEVVEEAEVSEISIPIDDVRYLVDTKLAAMTAPEKIKFLKDTVRVLNTKNLTDQNYRYIYSVLTDEANKKKEEETK